VPAPILCPEGGLLSLTSLRELGWIEGKNISFERRFAENQLDRLPILAAELVRLDVDVVVTLGTLAPLAAKQATTTTPIVMIAAGDPVGSGLAANLARPGGNVTGTSLMAPDLAGKRLELLKEIIPGISHVAVLWNAANPYSALVLRETQNAARTLRIELQSLEVRGLADVESALDAAIQKRADALVAVEDPLTITVRQQIADFTTKKQLPAVSGLRQFAEAGALMTFGADVIDMYRKTARYVDRILKSEKPADLPIEQPTKFELVINLKTAKALGRTIPQTLLVAADELIE
jgi:putative ABC transport system substrate-binding protein